MLFRVGGISLIRRHVDNCIFCLIIVCLILGVSRKGLMFDVVGDSGIPKPAGIHRVSSGTMFLGSARRAAVGLSFLVGVPLPPPRDAHLPPCFWLAVSHPPTGSVHPLLTSFWCGFPAV